jgi:hypothetical protein
MPPGTILDWAAHRDPLAVGRDDQDRPFLGGGWRLDCVPERGHEAGEFLVHVLQGPRTQPQPQQGLERFGCLGERTFEAEPLRPILQDVGEVPRGQTEPFVKGDAFDLLPLARAVDGTSDLEDAEDRDVATVVRLGKASEGVPILSRDFFPEVTVAMLGEEQLQEFQTQGQQTPHQLALHLIDAQAVVSGSPGEGDEILEIGLGLEESLFRREDHDGLLATREHFGVVTNVLPQGGHFFYPSAPEVGT